MEAVNIGGGVPKTALEGHGGNLPEPWVVRQICISGTALNPGFTGGKAANDISTGV